jgi:hypothetical protein
MRHSIRIAGGSAEKGIDQYDIGFTWFRPTGIVHVKGDTFDFRIVSGWGNGICFRYAMLEKIELL